MQSELYELYKEARVDRVKFSADAIVSDIIDWFHVDINAMVTTPATVILNAENYKNIRFSIIQAVSNKYAVAVKQSNYTIVFKKLEDLSIM